MLGCMGTENQAESTLLVLVPEQCCLGGLALKQISGKPGAHYTDIKRLLEMPFKLPTSTGGT